MTSKIHYQYPKEEKLKNKNDISSLFEKGKWQSHGDLRIICFSNHESSSNKFGVSVSKKYFKKAIDRNRIKRLLRESYRLNKEVFLEKFGKNSICMLFYVSKNFPQHYRQVETQFLSLCKKNKT